MVGILPRRTLDCWVAVDERPSPRVAFAHACFNDSQKAVESDTDSEFAVSATKTLRTTTKKPVLKQTLLKPLRTKSKMSGSDSVRYSESYNKELENAIASIRCGENSMVANIFKSKLNDKDWKDSILIKCDELDDWFPFKNSVVQGIMKVHNSVIAIICNGAATLQGHIFFVSVAGKQFLRVIEMDLRLFRLETQIRFAPGEIWSLDHDNRCLRYYGPHAPKSRLHVPSERMIQGMYCEMYKGNVRNAVDQLVSLGLDICTTRSPFGKDLLAEVAMKMTDNTALFSSLLAIEPRIANAACLKSAVLYKRHDILKIILEQGGVDVMQRVDEKCLSILHFALDSKRHVSHLIGHLVSAGMDVPALDAIDPFLLHISESVAPSVVRNLCDAGARVNITVAGVPLLHHWMSTTGYEQHVDALVSSGYDINKRHLGRTALMAAALSMHIRNVRELVASGADVNARDDTGQTAADLLISSTPYALRVHVQDVLDVLNGKK